MSEPLTAGTKDPAGAAAPISSGAVSTHATRTTELDALVARLAGKAEEWARLPAARKAELCRACLAKVVEVAPEWAAAGSQVKGIDADRDVEEWMTGPWQTARNLRLLAESLEAIASTGKPPLGRAHRLRADGRLEIDVFPAGAVDAVAFLGFSGTCVMERGLDLPAARARQASFYARQDPQGGVALILGAGNVSSIPPMDAFTKLFVEGLVCVIKLNPVNEYCGPLLERCLEPLITPGYLAVVYGGGEVGKHLIAKAEIADVHMTGSDATHDLIVWGPPGPERERRKAANDPLLKKPISSELGNISPVIIVPWPYAEGELWFMAENVAAMITNNASFNCIAAKFLVLSAGWLQKDRFLELLGKALEQVPARKAYYPGAEDRYARLTAGRKLRTHGQRQRETLPWTLVLDVDAEQKDDPIFRVEPFCSMTSQTSLPEVDPAAFLAAATRFANDTLWGTLAATIMIAPGAEKDPAIAPALARAIDDLRYGTVSINHFAAAGYAFVTTPWGGHPSATLADVQSGLGWVHNTFMLEGIEKSVVRGPLVVRPRPTWFNGFGGGKKLGRKLVAMEGDLSLLRLPSLIWTAMFG
jgi:acyl-CoA reductase-like NAD-dependent aldehyde dehydrogenase